MLTVMSVMPDCTSTGASLAPALEKRPAWRCHQSMLKLMLTVLCSSFLTCRLQISLSLIDEARYYLQGALSFGLSLSVVVVGGRGCVTF